MTTVTVGPRTERDLYALIVGTPKNPGLARACGFTLFYHQRPAFTGKGMRTALEGDAGLPDVLMIRAPHGRWSARLLFAELKGLKGVVSEGQRLWIEQLQLVGAEAYVWYPRHWPDAIREVLAR